MKLAPLIALALALQAAPLVAQTAVGSGKATSPAADAAPAREAGRADLFAKLNGSGGAPAALSTRVPLATALRAVAEASRSFNYGGTGDAEYWMKTTRDFVRSGRGVGRAMITVAQSMGPGPVGAAIGGVGAQLNGLDASGTGDAHFWSARAKDVARAISAAGTQLDTIANSLSSGPDAQTVPLAAVLEGLAQVALTLDQAGHGDAEYWMRTTRNFVHVGRGVGRGLAVAAEGTPEPLRAVLRGMAGQLNSLSEGGTGSAQYWMARARGAAEQVRGVGNSLREIAISLP